MVSLVGTRPLFVWGMGALTSGVTLPLSPFTSIRMRGTMTVLNTAGMVVLSSKSLVVVISLLRTTRSPVPLSQ